jgi:hypothetical protein
VKGLRKLFRALISAVTCKDMSIAAFPQIGGGVGGVGCKVFLHIKFGPKETILPRQKDCNKKKWDAASGRSSRGGSGKLQMDASHQAKVPLNH